MCKRQIQVLKATHWVQNIFFFLEMWLLYFDSQEKAQKAFLQKLLFH